MIRQKVPSSSITKTVLALDLGDRIESTGIAAEANFFRRYAKIRFINNITINLVIARGRLPDVPEGSETLPPGPKCSQRGFPTRSFSKPGRVPNRPAGF